MGPGLVVVGGAVLLAALHGWKGALAVAAIAALLVLALLRK